MALERRWTAILPRPLTANGSALGVIEVADTAGFRTKMKVGLKSNTQPARQFQVQEVLSTTKLIVGAPGPKVGRDAYADVSMYTVADGATISAAEQDKNNVPEKDHYSAVYEGDPVIADRVLNVDQYGRPYTENNPLPVIDLAEITGALEPHIENIEVTDADTEQSFLFPGNTKRFMIRVRDGDAKMKVSWVEGESGSKYLTIAMGCNYSEEINVSGRKICFQVTKPNKIVELLYWTQMS